MGVVQDVGGQLDQLLDLDVNLVFNEFKELLLIRHPGSSRPLCSLTTLRSYRTRRIAASRSAHYCRINRISGLGWYLSRPWSSSRCPNWGRALKRTPDLWQKYWGRGFA